MLRELTELSARLDEGLAEFTVYGERSRDGAGRFVGNETGGADPSSMRQAYGPPAASAPPPPPVQVRVSAEPRKRSRFIPGMIAGLAANSNTGRRVVKRVARKVAGAVV